MNFRIIIQARSTSTRLPNKVMKLIDGKEALWHCVEVCKQVGHNPLIIIPKGDPIANWCEDRFIDYFEGDEENVLERHVMAMVKHGVTHSIRFTSDCPLMSADTLFYMISLGVQNSLDFFSNCVFDCVDGQELEFLSLRGLRWCHSLAIEKSHQEHVTTFIKENKEKFLAQGFSFETYTSNYDPKWFPKMSIDTKEDLERIKTIYKERKDVGE